MRTTSTLTLLLAFASYGAAQSTDAYLKVRKQYGISQSTTTAALETLVGKRTLEVRGIVKGTVSSDEGGYLYLETADGGDVTVKASAIPVWLRGGDVTARLIIHAERKDEHGSLSAELLAAATDESVARFDQPEKRVGRPTQKPTSRGAMTPAPATRNWNLPASEALPYYTAFIQKTNKRLTAPQAEEIARGVIGFSIQYAVDARLIMAIVLCESGFNPNSVSHSGARGLGQLMPGTAKSLGVSNSFDTNENLYGTVKLIRQHLDKYNKTTDDGFEALVLSLAAYNAGPGAVKRHGGVPPYRETQNYVRKVTQVYRQLCGN